MENTPQSLGGQARAASLTAEERSAIAKKAADACWDKKKGIPRAEHSGILTLGSTPLLCHVLSDNSRIIAQNSFMEVMNMYRDVRAKQRVVGELSLFMAPTALKPFIPNELQDGANHLIQFRTSEGKLAKGIKAELIPKICKVWVEADDAGVLTERQKQAATIARAMIYSLAQVGIVALVDECTGFQRIRSMTALERLCEKFIAEELRPWIRTFPKRFFIELARVKGIELNGKRYPLYFGHLINNLTYKRLAPGILEELKKKAARYENGKLKNPMHQLLTENHGHPKLREHISNLVTLLKITEDGDYEGFMHKVDKVLPILTNPDELSEEQIQHLITISDDEQ